MKTKNIFLILFFILVILTAGCSTTTILSDGHKATSDHLEEHEKDKIHVHADFKVYANDNAIDFSILMYQLQSKSVHVEDGIGDVMHIHKKGITIGDFFETLDIQFNKTCITFQIEGSYCNADNKKLSFYVNGIENNEYENYEIKDLDKILISYGKGDIEKQLESITNLASKLNR